MLTRIISGAVGVAIMIVIFIFHDTILLPIAVAGMIAIMLYELLRAVKLHRCPSILISAELCGMAMPFIYSCFYPKLDSYSDGIGIIGGADLPTYLFMLEHGRLNGNVTVFAFAITLLAAFVIFLTWLRKHKEIRYEQIFFTLAVMVFVPQAMTTMVRLDRCSQNGLILLILGLCGAWIADTGAYFTGVAIGKHKLCPVISPKKTIEGFVGGIVTTGIVFTAVYFIYYRFIADESLFERTPVDYIIIAVIGMICAVIGTVGDLSASMVKRQIGFKDYGKIMPGHGGLMDRFDSVLFVLPTLYAMIVFFPRLFA